MAVLTRALQRVVVMTAQMGRRLAGCADEDGGYVHSNSRIRYVGVHAWRAASVAVFGRAPYSSSSC
jgi:hypothetical protein